MRFTTAPSSIKLPFVGSTESTRDRQIANLGQVEALLQFLAASLAVLALAAVGYAIAANTRGRSQEFSIFRALEMTPRAGACVVVTHAIVIVVIACAIGVPLGLAVGTRTWTPIANGAHVVVRADAPAASIAALVGVTAVLGGMFAGIAAWSAFRRRSSEVLRTE